MLDLHTLDVLIGGVGGNPKNMGLVAPKDAFTPRIGAVYRLNDKTVLRSGYGATLDARGHVGTGSVPRRLQLSARAECELSSRPPGRARFGWYWHARSGHSAPRGSGSEHAAACALPNYYGMQTAVPESTAPRPHAFVERGVRAAAAAERVGRRRLCRQQAGRRTAAGRNSDDQHQQRAAHRRRRHRSAVLRLARTSARHRDLLAVAEDDATTRCRSGVTRPFTQGLMLKGHYTFSRSKALRTDYEVPTPEAQDRNWALANGDRPHTLHDGVRLPAALAQRAAARSIPRALINDWQINGIFGAFSGSPFTVTADGTTLEYAGQPADRRPRRRRHEDRRDRRRRASTSIRAPGRSPKACASATPRLEPVPRAGRLEPRPLGVPIVPSDRGRTASRRGSKRPTSPTRRTSATRRAASRAAISCASSPCTTRMQNGRSGSRFATASDIAAEKEPETTPIPNFQLAKSL